MNGALFLDTSGWFAALSRRESSHAGARAAYADQVRRGGALITTAPVLAEMHILLLELGGPAMALRFLDGVATDPTHEVIDVGRDLRLAAVERWLRRFTDQDLSLTDAMSFEVMRQRRLRRALALDRHFAVAGFELVPGPRA
ncbi:MAG TPA: PIN domain-containing protein [Gemmatimonadales bacterium]|nr:PIN domain-containing protein [Gemmatimonadales bacterium]